MMTKLKTLKHEAHGKLKIFKHEAHEEHEEKRSSPLTSFVCFVRFVFQDLSGSPTHA
jgi:ABC-type dipeptide/oligopeptide/nickel transport system ATPase subunit